MPDRRRLLQRPLARGEQSWYRIANKAGAVAEVYIYDEISWFGITAADFVAELRTITAGRIDLHLNSPGGDVFDAFAIYQALVDHKATVHVLVDSLAASAASFIAMAGERVEMGQAAMLMIHDAWGLGIGNAADLRDLADRLDKISDTIAGLYAARAGGPVDFWREAMTAETWYDPAEAVEAGLADVVRARQAPDDDDDQDTGERPSDRWDLSVFTYAGRDKAPPPPPRPVAKATASHHTGTDDSAWDAGKARKGYPNEAATLKAVHAWVDPSGDPDAKGSYKFPHHYKKGGPANLNGCRNGLSRLPGADIDDKDGVRRHLQAHLDDAPADSLPAADSPAPAVVVDADLDGDEGDGALAQLSDEDWAAVGATLRAGLDEAFDGMDGYDPEMVAGLIADIYGDAPAPPTVPPAPEPPRTAIPIDEFIDGIVKGIQEGVRP